MDEFLCSGETIVRNLELGLGRARARSAARCRSATCPTCSGTSPRCPRSCAAPASSRPACGAASPSGSTATTSCGAPRTAAAIRTEYLLGGYGNGAYLFSTARTAPSRLRAHPPRRPHGLAAELVRRRRLPRDVRHRPRRPAADPDAAGGPGARAPWGPAGPGGHPARTTSAWSATPEAELLVVEGELRSHARANILPGVLSVRWHLKDAMARAERMLARYAEPFAALWLESWPAAYLDLAWGGSSTPRATTRSRGAASTRQRYRWPPASPRASTRRRPCATGR